LNKLPLSIPVGEAHRPAGRASGSGGVGERLGRGGQGGGGGDLDVQEGLEDGEGHGAVGGVVGQPEPHPGHGAPASPRGKQLSG